MRTHDYSGISADTEYHVCNRIVNTFLCGSWNILEGRGYLVSEDGTTKVPGVFVAGDSRTKKYAQITIAVADGTIAALDAINYLNK